MDAHEYQTMFDAESTYWWFRALHGVLIDILKSLPLPSEPYLLDAGCGTGQNLVNLRREITPHVFGFDLSMHAAPFWCKRRLQSICCASINEIPYIDCTFDVTMSIDVLECDDVDEASAYSELWRVTKPGGYILLNVPAYKWLMTEEHHRAVHASRRYVKKTVHALLERQPVEILRLTYHFTSVFPMVAAYRLILKAFDGQPKETNHSEIRPLPGILNNILYGLLRLEARALRHVDLPFGSSILAVVKKLGS